MRKSRAGQVICCAALLLAAWVPRAEAQVRDLWVLGAASLRDAVDDANAQYERRTGRKVAAAYAASATLARQIENGTPSDIFISADLDWMDYLARRGLIKLATRSNFLGNKLVLIARAGSGTTLAIGPDFPLARALGSASLAMADPASVPAGKYGKAALDALGVWPSVAGRIAPARDVRAALALVSSGAAPLGIVYQTDAVADRGVEIVGTFPASSHPPIIYPMAVTSASTNPDASSYIAFLQSNAVKPAFGLQGFLLLH